MNKNYVNLKLLFSLFCLFELGMGFGKDILIEKKNIFLAGNPPKSFFGRKTPNSSFNFSVFRLSLYIYITFFLHFFYIFFTFFLHFF